MAWRTVPRRPGVAASVQLLLPVAVARSLGARAEEVAVAAKAGSAQIVVTWSAGASTAEAGAAAAGRIARQRARAATWVQWQARRCHERIGRPAVVNGGPLGSQSVRRRRQPDRSVNLFPDDPAAARTVTSNAGNTSCSAATRGGRRHHVHIVNWSGDRHRRSVLDRALPAARGPLYNVVYYGLGIRRRAGHRCRRRSCAAGARATHPRRYSKRSCFGRRSISRRIIGVANGCGVRLVRVAAGGLVDGCRTRRVVPGAHERSSRARGVETRVAVE